MTANIFISFASKDVKMAMTLCTALENRGHKCWISARDIQPGENFQVAIVQAIRHAKIMLLVFTANSNNSEEMTKELALASQQKMIVIPLRVEDVTPSDAFAYEFATRQWIDFFADWEFAIEQLTKRITNALRDRSAGLDTNHAVDAINELGEVAPELEAAIVETPPPVVEPVKAKVEPPKIEEPKVEPPKAEPVAPAVAGEAPKVLAREPAKPTTPPPVTAAPVAAAAAAAPAKPGAKPAEPVDIRQAMAAKKNDAAKPAPKDKAADGEEVPRGSSSMRRLALIGAAIVVLTGIGLTVAIQLRSTPAPSEPPPAAPTPALAPTVVQVEVPPPAVNEAVNAPTVVAVKAPPRKRAAATQSAPKDDIPF
jgi:hypothetical protein